MECELRPYYNNSCRVPIHYYNWKVSTINCQLRSPHQYPFFLIFKKIYPRILCFYHMQKRCHWRALQVYFYVVDGTRLISSCIFHNDLVCKCNIFKYSFFFRQIRVVLIKWFSYSSQTVSISILLRYSHHQIFVFIGKKKLILLRRHKIILKY